MIDRGDTPTEILGISPNQAERLLRLGLSRSEYAIQQLVDYLSGPDGESWFTHVLTQTPFEDMEPEGLLEGDVTEEQLGAIKSRAKKLLRDERGRMPGTLVYLLVVAAGLAHHDVLLSSRPAGEVERALLDLAAVLPKPWSDLCCRGSLVASSRADN